MSLDGGITNKMFRVIIISADPYRDEWILNNLSQKINLDYCLCIGDQQVPNDKINYLDHNKITIGEYEHYINWQEIPPLDESLIKQISTCESLLFRLMDDESGFDSLDNFKVSRINYLKHLRFWNWFLEDKRINLVINYCIPHQGFDSVIYELCKLKYIRYLSLSTTPITGLFTWIDDWEKSATNLKSKYQELTKNNSGQEIQLSKFLQDHYDRQVRKANPTPIYMESSAYQDYIRNILTELSTVIAHTQDVKFINNLRSRLNQTDRALFFNQLLIKFLLPSKPQKSSDVKDKDFLTAVQIRLMQPDFWLRLLTLDIWLIRRLKNRWILNLRRKQEALESQRRKIQLNLKRVELFGFYNEKAIEPDLSCKYIYVAPHYQPEATTVPLAGAFANQLLIVQMLAYCVPDDVLIYVKEHPAQDVFCRSIRFYQDIASIPNVRLIRRSFNTFELTTHAVAVATATGTVGWEALFKGKPVLMFGSYIYQYAPGVLRVKTLEDCKKAIYKIFHEGFKPNLDELKLFLKAIDETRFMLWLSEYHVEETMNNLTQSIVQHLSSSLSENASAINSPE